MSKRKFNNNRNVMEAGHEFQLTPVLYCDYLVSEYFKFVEGDRHLIDPAELLAIRRANPDKKEYNDDNVAALVAFQFLWNRFYKWRKLPFELRDMFRRKLKAEWKMREEAQGSGLSKNPRSQGS